MHYVRLNRIMPKNFGFAGTNATVMFERVRRVA